MLKDRLLPKMDKIRSIPGRLGFRDYSIVIEKVSKSGNANFGESLTETQHLLSLASQDGYGFAPRLQLLKQEEIAASNGMYQIADLKIGPITPQHLTGGFSGFDFSCLSDPAQSSSLIVRIDNADLFNGNYRLLQVQAVRALSYFLIIRKIR